MTSRSSITSALLVGAAFGAAAVVLAACTDDPPDLTIKGTRHDTTTALNIELCPLATPPSSTDCGSAVNLFDGVTDTQRTADVFVDDGSVELTAYLQTPNVICVQVAITLHGEVHVDYTTGAETASCSPMESCIPTALSDTCGE
jgi:hypothetical protein